jgi:hypothetical protein
MWLIHLIGKEALYLVTYSAIYLLPCYRREVIFHSTPKTFIMKSVFSICKIFAFGFFVICIFSYCTSYLDYNGQKVPKKVTIYVSGYDTSNGNLILKDDSGHDATNFPAFPSQIIRWKLSDPRNHKIDSIYPKPTNQNLIFADTPQTVWLSKSWKGTVKEKSDIQSLTKDTNGVINYEYKIVWDTAGVRHTYDPRIQIR